MQYSLRYDRYAGTFQGAADLWRPMTPRSTGSYLHLSQQCIPAPLYLTPPRLSPLRLPRPLLVQHICCDCAHQWTQSQPCYSYLTSQITHLMKEGDSLARIHGTVRNGTRVATCSPITGRYTYQNIETGLRCNPTPRHATCHVY